MKQRLALMSVLLMLLAIVPASAQQGPPPGGPPPPQGAGPVPLEFVLRAIDLTPAQRAQIEPLMRARHEAADAARPAAEAAGRALAEQVQDGTFDEADRAVADAALLRDIRALLTPAQREKFDRLLGPPPPPASQPSGGGPVRGRQR
jgi:Spy/CpxP family protein refolding chaperone